MKQLNSKDIYFTKELYNIQKNITKDKVQVGIYLYMPTNVIK